MSDYFLHFRSFYSNHIGKKDKVLDYPALSKIRKKKFDKILLYNLIGQSTDLQPEFEKLRLLIKEDGLLILTSINPVWGRFFGYRDSKSPLVFLWFINNLLDISGYKIIRSGYIAIPPSIPIVSFILNLTLPIIPKLKRLLPFQFVLARPKKLSPLKEFSVSVIIPTFNEEGNVADCIKQLPSMGKFTEIIIADDGSTDETLRIARSYKKKYPNLKVLDLPHKGKVWAVKAGFEKATGEILMIWDADRTVDASELPRFYRLLASGQAEYAQGTRLAYPMEKQAMRLLNLAGNFFFGWLYTFILNTQITDTLCGTKVIFKKDFNKIEFGTEPWGDFDLLFGAKRLGLRIKEVPVHYKARVAGLSKMKTFRYGMVVAKMSLKAFWEFKVLYGIKKIPELFKGNFALGAIFLLAAFVRFWGLMPNLPYHPDEGYIQKASHELFLSIVTEGNFEPKAYKYGSIVLYIQALTYMPFLLAAYFLKLLSFISIGTSLQNQTFIDSFEKLTFDFRETIFWAQRAGTAFFGTLSVILVFLISKKLFSKTAGIIAALVFAVTPSHVRSSHWVTTDVLSLFTILLALFCIIHIYKTGKWRWYILSGLAIGIASSIRYFPIALLVYPIAFLFDPHKSREWFVKILTGFVFVFIGFVISTPFLFFSKESQEIFHYEMTQHVLPFYGTAVSAFATEMGSFIFSLGKTPFPDINTLNPTKFQPFYSSFLTFKGFGLIPTIASLIGAVVTLIKYPKHFLIISIIPFANWFYISYYMHASYDRLVIPILPFLAVYIGVLIKAFWDIIKNRIPKIVAFSLTVILMAAIIHYPLNESISSSIACSKPTVFKEAELWIDKNIPVDAKVAHIPIFMFPSKPYPNLQETTPNSIFYPEELKKEGYQYMFMNDSRFGYNLYPFYTDFFIRPEVMYQNSFIPLVLKSYETQTEEVLRVTRPEFCDPTDLLIYKLPTAKTTPKNPVKKFNFYTAQDIENWRLQIFNSKNRVNLSFNAREGREGDGSLEINWDQIGYTGPRVYSEKIPVEPNKFYLLTGWIKASMDIAPIERDGFLRMDFYAEDGDILLPGESVILSERVFGKSKWRPFSTEGKAPENARYGVISAQLNGSKTSGSFYFDDLELYTQ